MTAGRRTPQDFARRRALADAAAGWTLRRGDAAWDTAESRTAADGWVPRRGDAVWDTAKGRAGVVIAIPADTGTHLYHLCPPSGGAQWVAHLDDLQPHEGDAPDGRTLNESVMPPPELITRSGPDHPQAPSSLGWGRRA